MNEETKILRIAENVMNDTYIIYFSGIIKNNIFSQQNISINADAIIRLS